MIGIFDSGLGGLTIFREIEAKLPQYDYLYLGDNARAPYGDHSQETILRYTTQAVEYLFGRGCMLVVLACNTASAEALRAIQQGMLRESYPDRNVLGVIRPMVEAAVSETRTGAVGVMGTRSTILSYAYVKEIKKLRSDARVVQQACRLLVPLIEEGFEGKPETRMILKKYIRPLKDANVDTVILGCTHYGILESDIRRLLGARVTVLSSGATVANSLAEYLKRHPELEDRLSRNKRRQFMTTEQTAMVSHLAQKFLGRSVEFQRAKLSA